MTELRISGNDLSVFMFLLPAAISDLRKQMIPAWLFAAAGIADLLYSIYGILHGSRTPTGILLGLLPGMILLTVWLISDGRAGIGDGCAMLLMGIAAGLEKTFIVTVGGLFLMSAVGVILILSGHGNRNTRLPFLPFCLVIYGGILCSEL